MALAYLKINPEDAVKVLEACFSKGACLADQLESEYREVVNGDMVPDEKLQEWEQKSLAWAVETNRKLSDVFLHERQQYNFRQVKPTAMMRIGINTKFDKTTYTLKARLETLNSFIDFIFQHGNVSIIAGRDVNIQGGTNNSMEVQNGN